MSCPALTIGTTPATLIVSGQWTAAQSVSLERLAATLPSIDAQKSNVVIDLSGVEHLDTLGAWLLERVPPALPVQGTETDAGRSAGAVSRSPRKDT